jgi:glycosyltransferase involved in cell wall biosynthesis
VSLKKPEDNSMKILRVIASMDPASGGPCQGIRNSIPELSKLGVENEVVSLDDPGGSFLGKDDFVIHALGPSKSPWQYSNKLFPWLLANLHRFDAVIAHGLWLYPSHAAFKAVKEFRSKNKQSSSPRLFVMPHGMLDPYFQKAGTRKLKAIRNWVYWKLIEGSVVNGADGVLFTCQAELELARIPFQPYHPKSELNVGYGIPAPMPFKEGMRREFEKSCPGIINRPYYLFLSRIHEKKGVDLLIKAYSRVIENKKDNFPALVIAGPGSDSAFGKQLMEMVSVNEQLRKNVFFTGMLEGNAKWGAFYGCEAFVLPSHQENFGIAVVEALACRKPVLISNQVNIYKEIKKSTAGLVMEDSETGTIQLLTEFSSLSPEDINIMNKNARSCYEQYFSIDKAASNLLNQITS